MLGTRQQLGKVGDVTIMIGDNQIPAVSSAQNLGVHFDRELKWVVHMNHFTSNLYHTLRKVAHVWQMLKEKAIKQLYRLLYCLRYITVTVSIRVLLPMLLRNSNGYRTWDLE